MNTQVEELLDRAKQLTPDQRIELADLLYADVPVNSSWERDWAAEAQSRIEAYRRGEIEAVDADEMHARIEEKYGLT
jgi:putative addiction module component (TIGR02574 family)